MSDDEKTIPFHAPHHPPAPPRQPKPGELPFEFRKTAIAIAWNAATTVHRW